MQERPCGATEKALCKGGVSREKPSLQTSKLPIVQSACGSTPLICSKSVLPKVFLAKRRNNLRFQLRSVLL